MTERVVQKDQGGMVFYDSCTSFILSDKAQLPFYEYQACLVEEFSAAQANDRDASGEDAESRDLRQGIFDRCHSSVDGGDEAIRKASIVAQRYARRSAPWWGVKREKPLFSVDDTWEPLNQIDTPDLLDAEAAWVGERGYPAQLSDPKLHPKLVAHIKEFDLLAFTPQQSIFWGMAARPNQTPKQREFAARNIGGTTIRYHADIQGSIKRSFWFQDLKVGGVRAVAQKIVGKADVLLLSPSSKDGVLTTVSKQKIADFMPEYDVETLLSDMISVDSGRCRIYREASDYAITRTVVLVPFADQHSKDAEPLMATVACIARGFYYHAGLNNVLNIPNEYFVNWRKFNQSLGIGWQNSPRPC